MLFAIAAPHGGIFSVNRRTNRLEELSLTFAVRLVSFKIMTTWKDNVKPARAGILHNISGGIQVNVIGIPILLVLRTSSMRIRLNLIAHPGHQYP